MSAAAKAPVGFVGLGSMGGVLAANLVAAGFRVTVTDLAGAERAPDGASFVPSAAEVARHSDAVVLSLPDGDASARVAEALRDADARRVRVVIDTSTIGIPAAQAIAASLAADGVGHVDAPVSGGPAGARARTLAIMFAGSDADCAAALPVLEGLSDRRFRVGTRPGQGQALKLANNFLSATALAATSEAVALGVRAGLDMTTMLEVLGASSGRNSAVSDKFPSEVVTGRYASGFTNSLMCKDLDLYLEAVREAGAPAELGALTVELWRRFAEAEPGVDFTRIYPFVSGER